MYELTFVLSDEKDLESITSILTSVKAKVMSEEKWGKRLLSYPINKHTSAYYYTWQISLEKTELAQLKKKLNFNEVLLRYLLLRQAE